jgi:hypothetical protein
MTQATLEDLLEISHDSGQQLPRPPAPSPSAGPSAMARVFEKSVEADLRRLEEALSHVSPDVERGSGTIIDTDGKPVAAYWFGVILAIRREFGGLGEALARKWSMASARYSVDGFDAAWAEYDPNHPKPVTLGSVYMLARHFGWSESAPTPPPVYPSGAPFTLHDREAIMRLRPTQWRVKSLFPTVGTGAIFGPSASGKSFLAIDMAMAIAAGDTWFGYRTTAAPVIYVMLEGESALRNRITAWEKHSGQTVPANFSAVLQPFGIANVEHVEQLGALVQREAVVILDTLNRAAQGLDENASQDMGRILAGMKRLSERIEGLVLVVHHTGKDASKGLRGHSSLFAGLDGIIEVERKDSARTWRAAKVKDAADDLSVPFKLVVVQLGIDPDGDAISSCAVAPDAGAVIAPTQPKGANQRLALAAIRRALAASPTRGKGGGGPQTPCITTDDAISAVAQTLTSEQPNKRRNRAKRIVESLVSGQHLHSALDSAGEGWVW